LNLSSIFESTRRGADEEGEDGAGERGDGSTLAE